MPLVRSLHFYIGKSPAAKNAVPAANLHLDDDGFLCQRFRRDLLDHVEQQRRFHVGVQIPELPLLDLRWSWAGQTAGVALWERDGQLWAGSILVNGLELAEEEKAVRATLAAHGLNLPEHIWPAVEREPKPLIAMIYPQLGSMLDPVLATAAPALANSFFALFGTHDDDEDEEE